MLLAKKVRLQVSEQDAATLEMMQGKCRGLYNWWVMKLRAGERWNWQDAKKTLAESRNYDPDLDQVYGKLLAEVYFRLDKAMQAFFKRVPSRREARLSPRAAPPSVLHPLLPCHVCAGGRQHGAAAHRRWTGQEGQALSHHCGRTHREARQGYKKSPSAEMPEATITPPLSMRWQEAGAASSGAVVAFDLGIKTLATGVNDHGRFYHIGGFKGHQWYNKQLDKIRSKRDRCKKKSRRYIHLSQVYRRVSEKKQNKRRDCLHKASHLIAHRLVERTVVIGDLSQRQMVTTAHAEHLKALHRSVYNDWGLYQFVQMLTYKCLLAGKELVVLDERDTSKTCSRCGHCKPCRCRSGRIAVVPVAW